MKCILISSTVALATALIVTGCETDPNSSAGAPDIRPMASKGQANANPAITFKTTVTSRGKTYDVVDVSDSDGANLSEIYKASSVTTRIQFPVWSANGGTIAFSISDSSQTTYPSIYLRDISVSNGKVSASNTRSIHTTSDFGKRIFGLCWSPVSSENKIAFLTAGPVSATNSHYQSKVQVVSGSGGTPTVLYASDPSESRVFTSVSYSSDGSKIAFVDHYGVAYTNPDTIRVINASTGALLESIALGSVSAPTYISWSRSGLNVIAFTTTYPGNSTNRLYYVAPTTGSTPSTNNVVAKYPAFSPNNSAIISSDYQQTTGSLLKTVYGTSTTSTISTGSGSAVSYPDWKR